MNKTDQRAKMSPTGSNFGDTYPRSDMQFPKQYPQLKGINFSFCNFSAAAELAVDPKWSLVLSAKTPCGVAQSASSRPSAPEEGNRSNAVNMIGQLSLEGRRYFDMDGVDRRGFMSARIGTSKNVGMALGLAFSDKHKEHNGLSVHVGGYANLAHPLDIKPTLGISFAWSSF